MGGVKKEEIIFWRMNCNYGLKNTEREEEKYVERRGKKLKI